MPGYFMRCSPASWSRSAHNSSTLTVSGPVARLPTWLGCQRAEGPESPGAAAGFDGADVQLLRGGGWGARGFPPLAARCRHRCGRPRFAVQVAPADVLADFLGSINRP